jgi:hypothetical protein
MQRGSHQAEVSCNKKQFAAIGFVLPKKEYRITVPALGMQATTEGAIDMKLDMTQIQDGFPGNEHAYSTTRIADDIVQLFARSGVSYTPCISGCPEGTDSSDCS